VAILAELGRVDEARSLVADAIAQMNERGQTLFAAHSMQMAWQIEMLVGDHAAAQRMAGQGCEQLDRLGDHSLMSTQACELAEGLYALGRYEEADQWARRGLELGSSDDLATQVIGLGVRSMLLAREGETSAALALAERVDDPATTSDDPRDPGDAALYRAEITYLTGDLTRAQEIARRAIECYLRNGGTARVRRLAVQWAPPAQRHRKSPRPRTP
jgi:tetratricopeptide (TPR) repeat protein